MSRRLSSLSIRVAGLIAKHADAHPHEGIRLAAPFAKALGRPDLARPAPVAVQQDTITCEECGDVVPWVEAHFFPFATTCDAEDCNVRAQRKFDGLPPEA